MGVSLCLVDLVDCRAARPEDAEGACIAVPEGYFVWEYKKRAPRAANCS